MTMVSPPSRRNDRQARRKQETRERLIEAALAVIAKKGPDAATINDITEAADVGFGSFYNHFQSKEEIRAAVMQGLVERFGSRLDKVATFTSDPIEVIAISIRLVLDALSTNPEWADFMANGGRAADGSDKGFLPRLNRDLDIAERAGVLTVPDRPLTLEGLFGAVTGMIQAMRRGEIPISEAPLRITRISLRLLGVSEPVIADVLARPLPPIPMVC